MMKKKLKKIAFFNIGGYLSDRYKKMHAFEMNSCSCTEARLPVRRALFTLPRRLTHLSSSEIADDCVRIPNGVDALKFVWSKKEGAEEEKASSNDDALFKASAIIGRSLFLGDYHDAKNISGLRREGITHIVSCCPELHETLPTVEGITYLRICLYDRSDQQISKHFDEVYNFILEAFQKDENAKVLVHCAAGVSRSATLVVSFLMRYFSVGYMPALETVCEIRNKVCPNFGFLNQLRILEMFLGV